MARDLLDLFSMKTWRCSWSLAATIASVLALASVVHLFLFPLTPSLDYFKLASNSCVSSNASVELFSKRGWDEPAIDLKIRFPGDLHGSVAYKGAPWKDEIGRWLAGCDSVTKEINVSEIIGGNECKNDCSGLGVCNQELGQCRCFHGYAENNEAHLALGTTLFHSGMCIQDMISFEDVLKEFTSKKCGKLGKLLKESGNHGVQMKHKDSRAPKLTVKHA
ncbi:uncharacterized protein LOC131628994 [Vicia villosa]|uniref:uncharacterized protein LOC131628994 n=1 Tax=Vicia villosa TaxID=3911 RepID=UPI00273A75F9|nr:uncharacterized protein LOC131628994 [Vicia villosa]